MSVASILQHLYLQENGLVPVTLTLEERKSIRFTLLTMKSPQTAKVLHSLIELYLQAARSLQQWTPNARFKLNELDWIIKDLGFLKDKEQFLSRLFHESFGKCSDPANACPFPLLQSIQGKKRQRTEGEESENKRIRYEAPALSCSEKDCCKIKDMLNELNIEDAQVNFIFKYLIDHPKNTVLFKGRDCSIRTTPVLFENMSDALTTTLGLQQTYGQSLEVDLVDIENGTGIDINRTYFFKLFLFFCTGRLKLENIQECKDFFTLADYLQSAPLQEVALKALREYPDEWASLLQNEQNEESNLYKNLFEFCLENPQFFRRPGFYDLPYELVMNILSSDRLQLSEDQVCAYLTNWIRRQNVAGHPLSAERLEQLVRACIRIPNVSFDATTQVLRVLKDNGLNPEELRIRLSNSPPRTRSDTTILVSWTNKKELFIRFLFLPTLHATNEKKKLGCFKINDADYELGIEFGKLYFVCLSSATPISEQIGFQVRQRRGNQLTAINESMIQTQTLSYQLTMLPSYIEIQARAFDLPPAFPVTEPSPELEGIWRVFETFIKTIETNQTKDKRYVCKKGVEELNRQLPAVRQSLNQLLLQIVPSAPYQIYQHPSREEPLLEGNYHPPHCLTDQQYSTDSRTIEQLQQEEFTKHRTYVDVQLRCKQGEGHFEIGIHQSLLDLYPKLALLETIEVLPETVKEIVDYLYTNQIHLTKGNWLDIYLLGKQLGIAPLGDACFRFVRKERVLTQENVLKVWRQLDLSDEKLFHCAMEWLLNDFCKVVFVEDPNNPTTKKSPVRGEWLAIPASPLDHLLKHPFLLCHKQEELLAAAALLWLQAQEGVTKEEAKRCLKQWINFKVLMDSSSNFLNALEDLAFKGQPLFDESELLQMIRHHLTPEKYQPAQEFYLPPRWSAQKDFSPNGIAERQIQEMAGEKVFTFDKSLYRPISSLGFNKEEFFPAFFCGDQELCLSYQYRIQDNKRSVTIVLKPNNEPFFTIVI